MESDMLPAPAGLSAKRNWWLRSRFHREPRPIWSAFFGMSAASRATTPLPIWLRPYREVSMMDDVGTL